MSIINSIPAEWRSLIEASTNVTSANPIPITPTIKLPSGNEVPILDISLNRSIKSFCSADGRAVYGHVITKSSWMGRFT